MHTSGSHRRSRAALHRPQAGLADAMRPQRELAATRSSKALRVYPRPVNLGVLALGIARLLWLASCFSMPWSSLVVYGGLTVSDVILLFALLFSLLTRASGRIPPIWVLFMGLVVLSAPFWKWEDAWGNAGGLANLAVALFALPLASARIARCGGTLMSGVRAFVYGSAGSAIVAMLQVLTGVGLAGPEHNRAPGLAAHENTQGGTLAIASVAALALLMNLRGYRRVRLFFVLGLVYVGIVLSGSNSGMIAAGMGLLFVLWRARIKPSALIFAASTIAAVIAGANTLQGGLAGAGPLERFMSATGGNGDISTVGLRNPRTL